MKTKVTFYYEKDSDGVFAYFPDLDYDSDNKQCYAHIGQHSACSPGYAKECKPARYADYESLAQELQEAGYKLGILNEN